MAQPQDVIIKQECTETRDILIERPINGRVKIYDQGEGIKRSVVSIAGSVSGGSGNLYGEGCSGVVEVGSSETMYSGTPYKITTMRGLE